VLAVVATHCWLAVEATYCLCAVDAGVACVQLRLLMVGV
jgi:hypothetical protein